VRTDVGHGTQSREPEIATQSSGLNEFDGPSKH